MEDGNISLILMGILKKHFDAADSHGGFFHENIKPATINCSS